MKLRLYDLKKSIIILMIVLMIVLMIELMVHSLNVSEGRKDRKERER